MILLVGGMLWIEGRRAEVRRLAKTAVLSDPPTADSGQEAPRGPRG
jgi:hypothetical protein